MKKIILLTILFLLLFNGILVPPAQAASPLEDIFGKINPPPAVANLGPGTVGINNVLKNIVGLIYIVASIIFIFMVIFSGFQWITSGGDKEAVTNARKRLTWAVIGVTVLALAFVIATVIGQITGFTFFTGQPSSQTTPPFQSPIPPNSRMPF